MHADSWCSAPDSNIRQDLPKLHLQGYGHACFALRFSPDDLQLAGAYLDGGLRIFDVARAQHLHTLNLSPRNLTRDEEKDDMEAAAEKAALERGKRLSKRGTAMLNLRWLSAGRTANIVATVDTAGTVGFWEVTRGGGVKILAEMPGESELGALSFSEGGDKLLVGGQERVVKVYDVEQLKSSKGRDMKEELCLGSKDAMVGDKPCRHSLKIMSLRSVPEHQHLFLSVLLWDLRTPKAPSAWISGVELSGDSLDISRDGNTVLAGAFAAADESEKKAGLTMTAVQTYQWSGDASEKAAQPSCMVFQAGWDSFDNTTIAAAGEKENQARIFERPKNGGPLRILSSLEGYSRAFYSASVSSDGRTAAFGSSDGSIVISNERKEKHKDKKDKDKKDKEGPEATSVGSKAPEPEEVAQKGDVPQPGPALQVDFGFPATVDGFFLFMRERERIRLRRESSQPYPWTDDRVLRHLRVRNVKKEHDRTSMLIRRLLLPLDDKWHSSESRQQKRAVVREYVLSLGLWRRFGSVNFIHRAGLVAGDATPEELSAKAVSVALDLWKNGIHSCSDAYGPASRAHAAELYAWLGEEASKHLSVALKLHPRHMQQMAKSLVTDAGLVIVSSGFLQVLNENGKAFRTSASQWAKWDSAGQANSEVFLKRLMRWQTSLWIKGPCDSHSWCSFWEPLMATGSVKASMQQRSFETFCRHPSSVVVVSISIAGCPWIGQPGAALTAWLSGLERQRCPTKCSWRSCSRSMAAGISCGPQASKTCPALTCNWGTCAPSWPSSNVTRGQRTAVPPGCLSWSAARHLAAPSTVSLDTRPSKARGATRSNMYHRELATAV
eukprot:s3592_g6.t1